MHLFIRSCVTAALQLRVLSQSIYIVLILAVGVGSMTASWTLFATVLNSSSPYPDPDSLVVLFRPAGGALRRSLSDYDADRIRTGVTGVAAVATYSIGSGRVARHPGDRERRARGLVVSSELFDVLKRAPQTGRAFTRADAVVGAEPVVIVTPTLSRAMSAGVGETVRIEGVPRRVVGITANDFSFPDVSTEYFVPATDRLGIDAKGRSVTTTGVFVVARLRAGASMGSVLADIAQHVGRRSVPDVQMRSFRSDLIEPVRGPIIAAQLGAGLIMLFSILNASWLLYARTQRRLREYAIRACLGATRGRLLSDYFAEVIVLCVAAVPGAALLAYWTLQGLVAMDHGRISLWWRPTLGLASVFWMIGIAMLAGTLAALPGATTVAALGRGGVVPGRSRLSQRSRYIALGAAAAVIVAVCGEAVRLTFGLTALMRQNVGYGRTDLNVARVTPSATESLPDDVVLRRQLDLYDNLRHRGLDVALANALPLGVESTGISTAPEGDPRRESIVMTDLRIVTPSYFEVTDVAFLAGGADAILDARLVIINRALANRLFGTKSALGESLVLGSGRATVGGVVDTRVRDLTSPATPEMYVSYAHLDQAAVVQYGRMLGQIYILADGASSASEFRRAVNAATATHVPGSTVEYHQFRDLVWQAAGLRALLTTGLSFVTAVGLLLMGGGLYGIVHEEMDRSFRDRCVRVAIGATPGNIAAQAAMPLTAVVAAALLVGIPAMWAAGRLLAALHEQVADIHPPLSVGILGSSVALVLVVVAASAGPIAKATQCDAARGLRL
jgi:putative ABC transport system permease protein